MTRLPEPQQRPGHSRQLLPPSISWRLPLWIFLSLVVILLASAGFAGIRSRTELEKVLQTNLEEVASLQAKDVENELRQHIVRLEALASSAPIRDQIAIANNGYPNQSNAEIRQTLLERNEAWIAAIAAGNERTGAQTALVNQIQFHPLSTDQLDRERQNLLQVVGIESTYLLTDNFGRLIAANSNQLPSTFYYADHEWWQAVTGNRRHYLRGPLYLEGDENIRYLEFAVPIRDRVSGDTIGTLYSTLNFSTIEGVIGLQGTSSSNIALMARNEAQPEQASAIYTTANLRVFENLTIPLDPATEALYPLTSPDNTDYILTVAPIASSLDIISQMGWYVAALQEESAAFAPIAQAEIAAVVVAIVIGFIVIGILYFLYIRPLTESLETLRQGAEALQSGAPHSLVTIQRNDELGVLATTFNDMARRLRQQLETQEQIINDRTASLERQAERLRLSAEVGRTVSASLDLERLMSDTVQLISSQFGFYHANILLVDSDQQKLVLRAGTGEAGRSLVSEAYNLSIDESSIVGWVAANKKARVALDVGADPVFFDDPHFPETRSEVALPLFARGQLVGVLDVQSKQANDFRQEDVAILQIMADQLASSILNAQLFNESQHRANLLADLQVITDLMNQQATLENALQVLSRRAMKLLDSDGGGVFLWNEAGQYLELVISYDTTGAMVGRRLAPGEGLSGRAFREGQTIKVDDYQHWTGMSSAFSDAPFHAAIAVPLRQQDRPIGVLILTRSQSNRPYGPQEVQVLDLLAAQAGTIISNSQLVDETRRLARRERTLNRIAAEIRRSLDVQTVLETATRELGQTLNDKQIRVRLFAPETAEQPTNGQPTEKN
jgi:GAF domain-containing protein/HAMP domain-containing protein